MNQGHPEFEARGDEPVVNSAIREAAAQWVVRRDRGLSEREAADYELWLKADPRHRAASFRASSAWGILARVPVRIAEPIAAKYRPRRRWSAGPAFGGVAAAVAIGIIVYVAGSRPSPHAPERLESATPSEVAAATPRSLTLSDGTIVRLNAGAAVLEHFSPAGRDVRLDRGEAHFTVTPDPARPFVVHAAGVTVRAVGTAFNVHLQAGEIDVLVTEGKVQVNVAAPAGPGSVMVSPIHDAGRGELRPAASVVKAGQRARVALKPAAPAVIAVSEVEAAEIARSLAWRQPLLRLGGATLADLALEFERQTGRRIVLDDPALGSLRIGGRFQSDDVDGFVRVLEENYGIRSVRAADGTISLAR